jgi:hypothetical protein
MYLNHTQYLVILIVKQIFARELVVVHQNGIVIECGGLFCGQLLVKLEKDLRSIVVLVLAHNPDLKFASYTFQKLVQSRFTQCISLSLSSALLLIPSLSDEGYHEHRLCSLCIETTQRTEDLLALNAPNEV